MVVERKPHPVTYEERPLYIELVLGGKKVRVYELHTAKSDACMMLVTPDMFDAILKEKRRGKASQKAKT